MLPHTTHMTLYSDREKLALAPAEASRWFRQHLLVAVAV